ncbi:MAG: hypothetical protein GY725_02210 [bacterium]|nr:hypothetical protein [bacterium]
MAENPPIVPAPGVSGVELLRLSRSDRAAAKRKLRELSPEVQAVACIELRPAMRGDFLMLVDNPEKVVPHLPEAEFAHTVLAGGLNESAWLLEIARPEQRVACIDLDCWDRYDLDLGKFREWVDALIEAGRATLARALEEFDLATWILMVHDECEIVVVGKEDEPPTGYFTPDGVVYFSAPEGAPMHRMHELTQAAWQHNQPQYWRLVYGCLFETISGCEEDSLRWRTNRLQDLGFPDREQAMRAYRPLTVEHVEEWAVPDSDDALAQSFDMPRQLDGTLIAEALSRLPESRAVDVLGYILAVANSLAVADDLPLSDPDSIPGALKKAVGGIESGLRALSTARNRAPHEVLDRSAPLDLFRVGASLDPSLRPAPKSTSQ